MTEQHPPISSINVRLRPECISVPKLAQHINLYFDSKAPTSPFLLPAGGGARPDVRPDVRPFGDPFRRILVWGAQGVGKRSALTNIVDAIGPGHALLVSGSEMSSPQTARRAVELLMRVKESGEMAVLVISDFDARGTDVPEPMFSATVRAEDDGEPAVAGHTETQLPIGRESDHQNLDVVARGFSEHGYGAHETSLGGHTTGPGRKVSRREALAVLRGDRPRPHTADQHGVNRILEAVKFENVPALIICSTSTNMTDLSALASFAGLFDQMIYAPLPSYAAMVDMWEDALVGVPLNEDVRTDELAGLSEGLTARDVSLMVRRAIADTYVAHRRPLEDLTLAQADLLAPLISVRPRFGLWADSGEPPRPEMFQMGIDARPKPPLPVIGSDLDRLSRGNDARDEHTPQALHQAALGELSATRADGSEGGWDSLLNGGLN